MDSVKSIRIKPDIELENLRRFVQDTIIPFENEERDSQVFSHDIPKRLHEMGVLQAVTPRAYGGQGASVADLIWIVREIGYGSPSVGATFIGNLLGYSAIVLYANEDLKARLCNSYLHNYWLWSFAMTEGGAGSDLMNIQTQARRVDGGFVLEGEKNFITNASHSSHLAIFARLVNERGEDEGISCFYVPGNTQGLMRGPAVKKIGWKKANTGTLILKDAFIPSENLLGQPGQGLRILTHCLNRSKTLLGAMGVGIATRALDLTVERLSDTKRFDKNLIDQPAIRHMIARLSTKTEAAWLLVAQAAATWDAGLSAVKESSMAKLMGGATAVEVASQTMELFGARGYLQEFEISKLVNDAKAIEIVEGPTLVQELLIAKEVLPKREKASRKENDPYRLQPQELKKAA